MSLDLVVFGAGQGGILKIFTSLLMYDDFLSWLWRGLSDVIMSPLVYFLKFSVKQNAVIAII